MSAHCVFLLETQKNHVVTFIVLEGILQSHSFCALDFKLLCLLLDLFSYILLCFFVLLTVRQSCCGGTCRSTAIRRYHKYTVEIASVADDWQVAASFSIILTYCLLTRKVAKLRLCVCSKLQLLA